MKAKDITEALLEKPSFIKTVQIDSKEEPKLSRWHRLLISIGIRQKPPVPKVNHDLLVTPAKLDTVYELSGLIGEVTEITKNTTQEHKLVRSLTPLLVKILATAIANKGDDVPNWLLEVIGSQFTNAELNAAAREVYRRLDYENFYGAIISLSAANMIDIPETPAHGQQSADLSNTIEKDGGQP